MKACKVCGKELADEATVCDGCGAELTEEAKTETVSEPVEEQTNTAEVAKPEKGFWAKLPFIMNIAAIAVMVIALVCAFLTGIVIKDPKSTNWTFFDMMKHVKKDGYFIIGLAGIFTLIHIIVTVAMIALACVRFFVKKKDVFPCFAAVLATTLFSVALVANINYYDLEVEEGVKSLMGFAINGAGIATVVITMLFFAVKSVFDIIVAKREGKAIALKIVTALTTLVMCVAVMGTSFPIYKRTYSDGEVIKYALGGAFADGVSWSDLKGLLKGEGIITLLCLVMTLLSIVLLSVCVLLRNVKERVKGVGRSYVIPSLIFYFFSFFMFVMMQSSGKFNRIAPTAYLETLLIVVVLALCITERVMQKKQLKAQAQPAVK